jgi:hypothetical protein
LQDAQQRSSSIKGGLENRVQGVSGIGVVIQALDADRQSRDRMASIAKKTKRYVGADDEEGERIVPPMPVLGLRCRPREVDFREVIKAVRYLVRSGCGLRMLPIHFGPWRTVYGWFRELTAAIFVPSFMTWR